jgi:hypothetical protein
MLHDERVDMLLRGRGAEAGLAHVEDLGLAPGKFEDRPGHQPVVDHHVGLVERAAGAHGEVIGVARTRAHEEDTARARRLAQMLGQKPVERFGFRCDTRRKGVGEDRAPEGPARAALGQRLGGRAEGFGRLNERAQRGRQLLLEMRLDLSGQHRRRAFRADGDHERVAVHQRRRQEGAAFEVVDDVVQHARRLGERRDAPVLRRIVVGAIDEPRARDVLGRHRAAEDGKTPLGGPVADQGVDHGGIDLHPRLGLQKQP